jgi:folate-dependent phosphoribosylglycinamide formyltransferase PurN
MRNILKQFSKNPFLFVKKFIRTISFFHYNLFKIIGYCYARVLTISLTGDRLFHNKRILGEENLSFNNNLQVIEVKSINTKQCIDILNGKNVEIVFVFGTGLLKKDILSLPNAIFINMHWGWSPNYRGEGIISALALEGEKGLGVTVHLCDLGADSGDILFREQPVLDSNDNIYSIGLKLTVIGTELFIKSYNNYCLGQMKLTKQDLSKGINYTSGNYMKQNYWMRLKAKNVLKQKGKSLIRG